MSTEIKLRRETAASAWTAADPVLAEGEVGLELDTGYHKVGDGTTTWNNLNYNHEIVTIPFILALGG